MKIRQSLVLILWTAFLVSCAVDAPKRTEVPFYVGTYSSDSSKGVFVSELDTVSGSLVTPRLVALVDNPGYLNFTADGQYLLVASKAVAGAPDLFVYRRDVSDNSLTLVDSLVVEGSLACYVSDVGHGWVALALYSSGDVVFVPVTKDGRLVKNKMIRYVHDGSGPDSLRQEQSHVHSVISDLKGRYAYVADLGADMVKVYELKKDTVVPVTEIITAPGSGPRHIVIHPSGEYMTVLNELNSTIDIFVKDSLDIYSKWRKSVALLPDSVAPKNSAADIHFSDDGKYLYASVRGFNRLFMLSAGDKDVDLLGFVEEGINWPRNFSLDPSGHFVLVANRYGNSVIVYKRDSSTGKLILISSKIVLDQPVCVRF
jgi:6-phosphogluconolactonase